MFSISLLPIGSELLDGRVADTNSRFLSEKISLIGGVVSSILTVTDDEKTIHDSLSFSLSKSEAVIITGGLGPTTDDLTREVVAKFCEKPLLKDEASLEKIKELFLKRNRAFDPSNEKQALYPETGFIIPNPVGTAPGFYIIHNSKLIIALPGVPKELYAMWDDSVIEIIKSYFKSSIKRHSLGFKTFDLPESVVGARINALEIPTNIFVSYRAAFPEIEVKFSAEASQDLQPFIERAKEAVGKEFIFTNNLELSFPQVVSIRLKASKKTIATAESCTAGLIAKLLTDESGSSSYYLGGVNAYANDVKVSALDVPEEIIKAHGAVSEIVAEKMAFNARVKLKSDIGISVTGVAGPDGGSEEKPVGLFYIGVSTKEKTEVKKFIYPGSRSVVRTYAAYAALREILKLVS